MAELIKKSRQRKWQERKAAAGLCTICGQPAATKTYCQKHRVMRNSMQRTKKGHTPWHPGGRGRPPLEWSK